MPLARLGPSSAWDIWFDSSISVTGCANRLPKAMPATRQTAMMSAASRTSWATTLPFFMPIARRTPISYFRSRTTNEERMSRTAAPSTRTTHRKIREITLICSIGFTKAS